jgi:hypothetical protein
MAWEQRGNRSYYYRSHKVGGRVVKEYIGAGATAGLIAAHDEAERERREEDRRRAREEARSLAELAAQYEAFSRAVDALAAAALMAAGYRQHARGVWRKRRDVSPIETA